MLQPEGSSIDFDEPIAIMKPDLTISDFPDLSDQENDATLELPIEGGNVSEAESELTEETEVEPVELSNHEVEPQLDSLSEPENEEQIEEEISDKVDEYAETGKS